MVHFSYFTFPLIPYLIFPLISYHSPWVYLTDFTSIIDSFICCIHSITYYLLTDVVIVGKAVDALLRIPSALSTGHLQRQGDSPHMHQRFLPKHSILSVEGYLRQQGQSLWLGHGARFWGSIPCHFPNNVGWKLVDKSPKCRSLSVGKLWGVFNTVSSNGIEPYCLQQRKRQWHPTPVFLPGKSHGWRSLVGCRPWGRKELDTTEWLHFHFSLSCIGEGNGNPLQCSCLENPRDAGAWWAAIYGVAQSRTRLRRLSSSSLQQICSWTTPVVGVFLFLSYFFTHHCVPGMISQVTLLSLHSFISQKQVSGSAFGKCNWDSYQTLTKYQLFSKHCNGPRAVLMKGQVPLSTP